MNEFDTAPEDTIEDGGPASLWGPVVVNGEWEVSDECAYGEWRVHYRDDGSVAFTVTSSGYVGIAISSETP